MEKLMNKTDYLRKKGLLPAEDLGVIYAFHSDRKGVSEIKELLIWEKRAPSDLVMLSQKVSYITYKLKESPYEISIREDETVSEHPACGSGVGDLWGYSDFGSLDRKALEEAREKELQRVTDKYINAPEPLVQLLERRFVTADGVIVWNEQIKGLIESSLQQANFTKQKVVSLFREFSEYRNSEEMHELPIGEEPMEFEDWFNQKYK